MTSFLKVVGIGEFISTMKKCAMQNSKFIEELDSMIVGKTAIRVPTSFIKKKSLTTYD